MITSSQQRIDEYTAKGWWGTDTLHSLLAQATAEHPERLAVADQPNREQLTGHQPLRLTYSQLSKAVEQVAEQWLNAGVGKDDKVIVQLPNIAELVVCYYAASSIGAILSPVPIQYGRHELQSISKALNSKWFVTTEQFREYQLAANALAIQFKVLSFNCDGSKGIVPLSLDSDLETTRLASHRQQYGEQLDDANRIMTICWTSGTTGTPKGVPRSHNMWLATTAAEIDACDYRPGDHLLCPFPLINMAAIGGLMVPCIKMMGSLFLHHPLDPELFLKQMQLEKITFTIAPPALLNQLAKSRAMWDMFDFSALRRIGSGSAPLAPWMVETFSKEYGVEVTNFYGSNEGICLLSTSETSPEPEQRAVYFPRLGAKEVTWQGAVYEFAKTKVLNIETGEEITEVGQAGELLIAGPTIFDGYINPDSDFDDVNCFTEDGYFHTGDMVEICGDPAVYYRVTGRCKDIINRGGMKISPVELDRLLESHPDLKEVAVCAYPDDRLGEKICVCIVPNDEASKPSLASLVEYLLEAGVAKYKMPEKLLELPSLPRNPMGKVKRFELQDIASGS